MRHAKGLPISNASVHEQQQASPTNGRPDMITFMKEWTTLAASGSGERGIFNIKAAAEACKRRMACQVWHGWERVRSVPPHQPLW